MQKFLTDATYGFIIGHMIDKLICRVPSRLVLSKRIFPGQPEYREFWCKPTKCCLVIFKENDHKIEWLVELYETTRNDLSLDQWCDITKHIRKKYLNGHAFVKCTTNTWFTGIPLRIGDVPKTILAKVPSIVNCVQNAL
jgi:hypothetical protein